MKREKLIIRYYRQLVCKHNILSSQLEILFRIHNIQIQNTNGQRFNKLKAFALL